MKRLTVIPVVLTLVYCVAFLSCRQQQHDIVFENFESSTFNNWEIQGSAFDTPYLADTILDTALKTSIEGNYFAYSYINDNQLNQGKLISNEFIIKHKYIDFKIAGGQHKTRTCINLLIDNKIVRTQSGNGDAILRKASWDVHEFIGEKAIIEIVDAQFTSTNDLTYIMVDNIVFSNHQPKPTVIFEDFESGTFKHWNVEGNAFKSPGSRKNIYYPVTVNGFEGKHFAFSFGANHDIEKGKLTSETFKINRKYITFLVGGGNHPDTTCINLFVKDTIVFSATGQSTGELRKEQWNVSAFTEQNAHIEILDNYSGRWGHIIVDNIRFTDSVQTTNAETICYHQSPSQIIVITLSILIMILVLGLLFVKKRKQTNSPSDTAMSKKEFQRAILDLLENEKIYLDRNLNQVLIAEKFELDNTQFQSLLENVFKKSFADLLNEYRVNCFKQEVLKAENKELKLVAIAEKCGFNSKSSFYRIFKKHTGITPTEYLENKKN